MHLLETPFFPLLFLLGAVFITAFSAALLTLGKYNVHEYFHSKSARLFFFQYLQKKFFPHKPWENLNFVTSLSKHILHLFYATTAFFYSLSALPLVQQGSPYQDLTWTTLLVIAVVIVSVSIFTDFIARLLATVRPKAILRASALFSSIYLTIFFPFTAILLKITCYFFDVTHSEDVANEYLLARTKIEEILQESDLNKHLDTYDKKLVTSFLTFREKLVREIMVPRMDIFSLSAKTSIREAAKLLAWEGYSRIPVYGESLDQIIGVVLYKDVLDLYAESEKKPDEASDLDGPLESIVKPVLYSPENKKISHLLQEFKAKQSHLAIVVDEYGATEGIVTIEDILEELVGEIEDEYDFDEEQLFSPLPEGGWVVDAKMSILDIEEKLGIQLPHSTDYETLGGYLFHRAGMIPSKGWRLQHDDFEVEVLSSNDRAIDKVQIIPSRKKRKSSLKKDTLQKKTS